MSKRDPVFSPDKADKICEVSPNIKHFITINVEGFSLVDVCGLNGKCILLLMHAVVSHSTQTCNISIQGHSTSFIIRFGIKITRLLYCSTIVKLTFNVLKYTRCDVRLDLESINIDTSFEISLWLVFNLDFLCF